MLLPDSSSSEDVRLVGQVCDAMTSNLRKASGQSGRLPLLDRVQAAIHCDSRWLGGRESVTVPSSSTNDSSNATLAANQHDFPGRLLRAQRPLATNELQLLRLDVQRAQY